MTASNVVTLGCSDDLPDLAYDPRVTRVYTLAEELDTCGVCLESGETIHEGVYYVSFDRYGMKDCRTYLCGPEHLHEELVWLLRPRVDAITNIVLHLPAPSLAVPDEGDDEIFEAIHALKVYVQTLPVTDVETFRNKVLAAVSSLGLARIEQLGRAS